MADLKARAEMVRKVAEKEIARHTKQGVGTPPEGFAIDKPLMGLQRYPEFKPLVDELRVMVVRAIQAKADKIESEMPYKQQFTLEELIRQLQELV